MNKEDLLKELKFKAIRSSGPGGQNVNKVASKVVLSFDLSNSLALTDEEKEQFMQTMQTKLTKEGMLILSADDTRSQLENKQIVVERFLAMIIEGIKKPKKRKRTKPSKAAVENRLTEKAKKSRQKSFRKKPDVD